MQKIKDFFVKLFCTIGRFFKKLGLKIAEFFKDLFTVHDGKPPLIHTALKKDGVQIAIASIICAVLGLLAGFLILLCLNPEHAAEGLGDILKAYFKFKRPELRLEKFGNMIVKAVPLLMCGLSVLFAYKTGLFNIGVAGQYCMGICASLFAALAWQLPWYLCVLFAIAVGAIWGMISGAFKAIFNVNEVIACIMTNWIGLYITNIFLADERVSNPSLSETYNITAKNPGAILPALGLDKLFGSEYVTIALILSVIIAIVISVLLSKTTFGYQIKATGLNKHAALYSGMKHNRNIIVTMAIAGGLAAAGASFYYLTGIENYTASGSLPATGFNGIAVAFLGGLNPIGTIFASLFVEHIMIGGGYLNTNYYNPQVADLIVAIIIYLCAFVLFIRQFMSKRLKKKDEIYSALLSAPVNEINSTAKKRENN